MKIFLAGTYSEQKNIKEVSESKYNLESFYYIKPWQIDLIKHSDMFLLDSGAFTFFSSGKTIDWNEYIERYADFINKNDIQYFFELDIDKLIGYDKVLEVRKRLERLTGKQSIPVWHKFRGMEEWGRMCDEYNYVAIGGIAAKEIKPKEYDAFNPMIKIAHKKRAKVHGLGFTNVRKLEYIKFDSVDSTRWNCARFGRLEYFDGKTIRAVDKRKDGKRLVGRTGGDIIGITLQEWVKFQRWADTHL